MKKYDKIIGLDLGNGLVKIMATGKNGKIYKRVISSVYAKADFLGLSLNAQDERDLDTYQIGDEKLVWGQDIETLKETIPTHATDNRYEMKSYKKMVKMVLAKIYNETGIKGSDRVLIVTGVPSAETADKEAIQSLKDAFTNNNGIHDLKMNDKQVLIKVQEEDIIVLAQPVATVVGRYLNFDGTVQNKQYESIKVAVVDIGGGTTDLDLVHNMNRLPSECSSLNEGFSDVYKSIRKRIKEIYPKAEPTDYHLLECIKAGSATGEFFYKPNLRLEPVDITNALYEAVDLLSTNIQNKMAQTWATLFDIDEILLVGGSAKYFKEDIEKVANGVQVPKNNGESNVEGYYKFGVWENSNIEETEDEGVFQ